ncbi:SDR family NAD(P)-dependent oxidoreductase [Pseudomaricurvus sp. HS19]|uniref:SDR family NAD(P)-dependent oxidoreductase n=1 Tax=Pseudomaricurvus sp. HS19 TaxID=2692626 RepID=UPI00136847F2|nr:SDR family oxidoreductase [Pseudomaricurvus sp. HS19]MYM63045.1 SDR family oxidoreductase [Pseudomaricurvus sp. HS19]
MQLSGKRIIVTGGASGIAASTVRAYVREGALVASLDITEAAGRAVVDAANAQAQGSGRATFFCCDISRPEQVFEVFTQAVEWLGGLDVLAHIAGIDRSKPAEAWTLEDMNLMWGINLNGTILCNQAACRQFQKEGSGAIINFASDVALAGMPNGAIYAASKGAVLSWTRTIAHEWASKYNIRCNSVNPTMKTPMFEEYKASLSPEQLQAFLASEKQRVPLGGEMGDADRDMAPVMVFLASDASHFINGQILPVNGGRVMLHG